ncbi:MAG: serine/threonine-protein kinase [Ottowia sp.]|nr:serine/threonine-protein kinase [Ottowia sp.]
MFALSSLSKPLTRLCGTPYDKKSEESTNNISTSQEKIIFTPASEKPFAEGSEGSVYLLHDQYGGKYAGKKFQTEQHLQKELQIYQYLGEHPGIVTCYGATTINNKPFLIMDYIDGGNMRGFIEKCDLFCKKFPKDIQGINQLRVLLANQLISTLFFLEKKGISHADLKPENIVLSKNGNIKIVDFGLFKLASAPTQAKIHGTLDYIAPEILHSKQEDFFGADAYSSANVLLELLTGFRLRQNYSELSHYNELKKEFLGKYTKEDLDKKIKEGLIKLNNNTPPPSIDILGVTGSFFPKTTEYTSPLSTTTDDKLNSILRNDIIKPLQILNIRNRSSMEYVHNIITQTRTKYISITERKDAFYLFEKINNYRPRTAVTNQPPDYRNYALIKKIPESEEFSLIPIEKKQKNAIEFQLNPINIKQKYPNYRNNKPFKK